MPSVSYRALTCMPQSHCHETTANINVYPLWLQNRIKRTLGHPRSDPRRRPSDIEITGVSAIYSNARRFAGFPIIRYPLPVTFDLDCTNFSAHDMLNLTGLGGTW